MLRSTAVGWLESRSSECLLMPALCSELRAITKCLPLLDELESIRKFDVIRKLIICKDIPSAPSIFQPHAL